MTGYRIYTTAHDKVVHARDILAEFPKDVAKDLPDYFDAWVPEAASPAPTEGTKPVRFLLDLSGSMRGRPIMSLLSAMRNEGDRLDAAGVPFEILGFTTSAWRGGQSRKEWSEAGHPAMPGRTTDLLHVVFKGMDESWSDCRNLFSVCFKEGFLKENIDGEALEWARARAETDMEESCLVMVSDGTPCCESTKALNPPSFLDDHLNQVLDAMEGDGVAFKRVRMGVSTNPKAKSLREGTDIPCREDGVRDWADIVQIARAKLHGSDEDPPPLRMGGGEDIPMNPISNALSEAVAEASRRLAAKPDNDASFSI
ncbi:hypothetical protein KUV57_13610 [Epibacterium sp. DP7N7-1]|nr:hypothetical protein [Epibacterium sp. DP7N7-1]